MKTLATILFLAVALPALAQTTNDVADIDSTYFHPAASMYIHGDTASASNLVVQGLAHYPENGKLLRLKELIDQQQEQNQDQDDQQQNQDQQNEQDQNQDQQQDQDQQNQDEQQNEQDQQQNQDQQQQDQQQDPQQQQEPPRAEQMSQDEAERLLDAMKQEEENKRLQLHPVLGAPVKVDKDW
ncbi:hypothetical protein PDESU_06460 [Pontiella desulfatans]|uniref:Uncharacterized protein n=1 Tax=Pontiella desulfatans TaxID=2750659 RepID=A0A6C2UCF1_PONDE|nr:hypothetical protein [Pontiella desulfatans]VGO17858.1 hypothetical protein PDESU_06460 [Pontiella desulfatans]